MTVTPEGSGGPAQECEISPGGFLRFSGYDWTIRNEVGGPGNNDWRSNNVSCDENGHLHLKITNQAGTWTTAEVETVSKDLRFGHYEFKVRGDLDSLEPNTVLGLFNYAEDCANEIDIEFSRWGDPATSTGIYGVYPASPALDGSCAHPTSPFSFTQNGVSTTTHRFSWQSDRVTFESLEGARHLGSWVFSSQDDPSRIPQNPMPVFINLWLCKPPNPCQAPSSGTDIIIESFSYQPDAMPVSAQMLLPFPLG